jgi:hypothetical protein
MIDKPDEALPVPPVPVVSPRTAEAVQKSAFDRLTAALIVWRKR